MEKEKLITHQEFKDGYKQGTILVYVNKNKAGDFVLSPQASKYNKPAHLFWSWSGIILTFILPITFIFVNWTYSIISLVLGLIITNSARKSATQFVLQNMIDDEDFWMYAILHKGAEMTDESGNTYFPKELVRLHEKFGKKTE